MRHDSLTFKISPALLDAMGLSSAGEAIDYFRLVGVDADGFTDQDVDSGLLDRSKVLRQWQASPQYGKEVVQLLGILHRAAKILKDSKRCGIYREELERLERGEEISPIQQFEALARAALAGQTMVAGTREQLQNFALTNGIDPRSAADIAKRVQDEMQAARSKQAQPAEQDENWEFRLAAKGSEGLSLTLDGLLASGRLNRSTMIELLKDAARFELSHEQVEAFMKKYCEDCFDRMVSLVANNRAVNEEQGLLLMPRAEELGLSPAKAHEIISNYSFTAYTVDDLYGGSALMESHSFDVDDIDQLVDEPPQLFQKPSLISILRGKIPDYMRNVILGVLCLGVGCFLIMVLKSKYGTRPTPVIQHVQKTPTPSLDKQDSVTVTSAATPSLTPGPTPQPKFPARVPLNADKLVLLEPEYESDPPAFSIYAHEVTNAEYKLFLDETYRPSPEGWTTHDYPAGTANYPVTGVSWEQVQPYLHWLALKKGKSSEKLQLPSHREYLRVLRGQTIRGNPHDLGYWGRARLGEKNRPDPAMSVVWDEIYIQGIGQVHNLVGNVAEWTRDEDDPFLAGVAGGDYQQSPTDYNHLELRKLQKQERSQAVGFRYVIIHTDSP
jgi:hypothetical protein